MFALSIRCAHGRSCPYCGVTMFIARKKPLRDPRMPTRDHVIPKSRMLGQGTIIVCSRCNSDKRNMTLPEWHSALLAKGDARAAVVKRFMDDNAHAKARWRPDDELRPEIS